MKIIDVSCLGSRERYALPVALLSLGALRTLYTDIYIPRSASSFIGKKFLPPSFRSLLERNHPDLPSQFVRSQLLLGIEFRIKIRKSSSLIERQNILSAYGSKFARNISRTIYRSKKPDVFIGFTGGALETFQELQNTGSLLILDQVDPGLYEWELVANLAAINPGWEYENHTFRWSASFEKRVYEELCLANQLIVNSNYTTKFLSTKNIKPV